MVKYKQVTTLTPRKFKKLVTSAVHDCNKPNKFPNLIILCFYVIFSSTYSFVNATMIQLTQSLKWN